MPTASEETDSSPCLLTEAWHYWMFTWFGSRRQLAVPTSIRRGRSQLRFLPTGRHCTQSLMPPINSFADPGRVNGLVWELILRQCPSRTVFVSRSAGSVDRMQWFSNSLLTHDSRRYYTSLAHWDFFYWSLIDSSPSLGRFKRNELVSSLFHCKPITNAMNVVCCPLIRSDSAVVDRRTDWTQLADYSCRLTYVIGHGQARILLKESGDLGGAAPWRA